MLKSLACLNIPAVNMTIYFPIIVSYVSERMMLNILVYDKIYWLYITESIPVVLSKKLRHHIQL